MSGNFLVTGAASGLGQAVFNALGGMPFYRDTPVDSTRIRQNQPFDAIIHCAFNSAKDVGLRSAFRFLDDNFLLTQRLLSIPHRAFIYISSLDVYPRLGRPVAEDDDVDLASLKGPYSFVKLFSDLLVQEQATNPVVLRPSTLLGPTMRPNTTRRVLTEHGCRLFLSGESRFNYVLHDDVVTFIVHALREGLHGVFNIASSGLVSLSEIVSALGLDATFGEYLYDIGPIDNRRAAAILPAFARDARETLNLFVDSLGADFVGFGRLGTDR